jgi:Druantia protein DruA
MAEEARYRGRTYTERELDEIRQLIAHNPDASRWFLSKELCRRWNWVQANGVLKDALCRGFLLALHRQGVIVLPACKRPSTSHLRKHTQPPVPPVDATPLVENLGELKPLTITMVRRTPYESLYKGLIHHHHYLGYTTPVGEHMEYMAFSGGRPLACIGWCSAPRHIGARDIYLGWDRENRMANLHKIAINTRFLILPWVRVPRLASHLLGLMARRIASDWETVYHHTIVWLETFVDPERGFTGTCYKAANWRYLGLTTGRGKNDNTRKPNRSLKYVFGYPLVKDFKKALYGVL